MNDPYDTLLFKWGENREKNKPDRKHIPILRESFNSYRIRSFCRTEDKDGNSTIANVLMWSHYADSHKGFCVKYHFSDSFLKTEKRCTTRFKDIIYKDREEPFSIEKDKLTTDVLLLSKHDAWSYENEVRLIACLPDENEEHIGIQLDDESFIESIYFGYRCDEKTITQVKSALKGTPRIQFFKMISDDNDIYSLKELLI